MNSECIEDLIQQHPFFKDLSKNHIQFISRCASNVYFHQDTIIAKEGDAANNFYMIRHGHVAINIHHSENVAYTVQTLKKGDVFGWSWLFPPYLWTFEAKAITDVRTTAFDAKCLRKKCEHDFELGYKLMKQFAQTITERLTAARLQLMDIYNIKPE